MNVYSRELSRPHTTHTWLGHQCLLSPVYFCYLREEVGFKLYLYQPGTNQISQTEERRKDYLNKDVIKFPYGGLSIISACQ